MLPSTSKSIRSCNAPVVEANVKFHQVWGPRPCLHQHPPTLTCVSTDMALEIEGVVEAFVAIWAQVTLHLAVAFQVTIQHALVGEPLLAERAGELLSGAFALGHL